MAILNSSYWHKKWRSRSRGPFRIIFSISYPLLFKNQLYLCPPLHTQACFLSPKLSHFSSLDLLCGPIWLLLENKYLHSEDEGLPSEMLWLARALFQEKPPNRLSLFLSTQICINYTKQFSTQLMPVNVRRTFISVRIWVDLLSHYYSNRFYF